MRISSEQIDGLDGAFNCESRDWRVCWPHSSGCVSTWNASTESCNATLSMSDELGCKDPTGGSKKDSSLNCHCSYKWNACQQGHRVALRGSESKAWRWQWSQLDKNHTALMRVHATIDILIEFLLTVEPLGGCLEPVNKPPNSQIALTESCDVTVSTTVETRATSWDARIQRVAVKKNLRQRLVPSLLIAIILQMESLSTRGSETEASLLFWRWQWSQMGKKHTVNRGNCQWRRDLVLKDDRNWKIGATIKVKAPASSKEPKKRLMLYWIYVKTN